jgi:hypothetical protein
MNTITVRDLVNYFAECDNLRNIAGKECSWDINYPENRFEISWGKVYELMEPENTSFYPFDKNKSISISDKGLVKLVSSEGIEDFFTFTKTLTPRDFQ